MFIFLKSSFPSFLSAHSGRRLSKLVQLNNRLTEGEKRITNSIHAFSVRHQDTNTEGGGKN